MIVRINVINSSDLSSTTTQFDLNNLKSFDKLAARAAKQEADSLFWEKFYYELADLKTEDDAYSIQFIENIFETENGDEYKSENKDNYDIVFSDSSTEIFEDVEELINNVFKQASTANLPKLTKHVGFDVDGDISVIAYKIKK